jgi:hypothetical protein
MAKTMPLANRIKPVICFFNHRLSVLTEKRWQARTSARASARYLFEKKLKLERAPAPVRGISSKKCFSFLSFAGLVAFAKRLNPIPSRTRPLNASAPMVLCLKTWESRSLPGLLRTGNFPHYDDKARSSLDAGWSSPVARQAHNLKVISSNLVPATKF